MEKFEYYAINQNNLPEKGIIEADDLNAAQRMIESRGWFVDDIKPQNKDVSLKKKKLKGDELAEFCRQIGNLLESGIPLIKAIGLLKGQDIAEKKKKSLEMLYKSIQKGESFSASMEKQGDTYDSILISMIKAGEASGNLDQTMLKMADYYDRQHKLNKKIKGALTYPIVLVVLVVVVVIAMFTIILPNFLSTFEGMELPLITKILMAISKAMTEHALLLIAGAAMLIPTIIVIMKIPKVRIARDKLKVHLPKLGALNKTIYTARFARTLSSLYTSGLGMVQSMQIAISTVGSPYIESQFSAAVQMVKAGEPLSTALETIDGFDTKLASTVFIGEESGSLDKMLVSMAETFDYDAEMATSGIVAILEPVMIIVIAGIVGVIAIGVMSPLMGIYNNIGDM